jgi:hypothetical protein
MSTKFRLYFCVSAFCIFHSAFLFAQGPAWWITRGVLDQNLAPQDYAPINQGQLKWLATGAYDEMNAYFGAGSNVASVINAFSSSNNYFPVNIGQAKYLAAPFYDRLYEFGLTNTMPPGMLGHYPWDGRPETNDYAMVNIGQIKYVFSFDSSVDSDGDGLSDWLEAKLGTDPYDSDSDDDGLSDGDEVERGTDPMNADTDGDGLMDKWEVDHGLDPLNASDGNQLLPLMLEQSRGQIVEYWKRIYPTPLVFTNTPGSTADLTDLKNALLGLSDVFSSSGVQ